MRTETWEALGTSVSLMVNGGPIAPARAAVEELLAEVDRTYSRFRADSELTHVNEHPTETIGISPLLATAIETALRGARLTDGLVDPTVGRHVRLVGYDDDFVRIAGRTEAIVLHIQKVPGWQALGFSAEQRTVRVPRGVELDLGSTGKALASDMAAAAALRASRAKGVLVSLGGDLAVAGIPPAGGWSVLVTDDSRAALDAPGETIAIRDGALATSSTTVRRWTRGDIDLHHIIDPRTGVSAVTPWRTVSVVAANCVDANIAATAAIIRGRDAPQWLAQQGLAARLVANDGAIVRVGGWPAPQRTAAAA